MTENPTGPDDTDNGDRPVRGSAWVVAVLLVVAVYGTALLVFGGEDAAHAVRAASLLPLTGALLLTTVVTLTWPFGAPGQPSACWASPWRS